MIAVELDDGSTRNSVVGCGHKAKPKVVVPIIEAPPELTGMLTIMELTTASCRWPMGDPRDPDFRYCGQSISRQSYCRLHSKLAFETTEQRRVRLR